MLFIVTLIAGRGLSSQHRLWLINTIIFIELRVYSSDVYWMNRAGVLNVTIPLKLSTYLVNETDYLPWSTALRHLRKLDSLLSFRTARRALHCFVRNLVTPLYNTLGWNTTSPHIQRSVYLLSIQRRPKQNKNRTKKNNNKQRGNKKTHTHRATITIRLCSVRLVQFDFFNSFLLFLGRELSLWENARCKLTSRDRGSRFQIGPAMARHQHVLANFHTHLLRFQIKTLKNKKKMTLNSSKFSALGFANIGLLLAVKRGEDASLLQIMDVLTVLQSTCLEAFGLTWPR